MNEFLMSVIWMVSLVAVGWVVVFQLNAWRYRCFANEIMQQEMEEREALEQFRRDAAEAGELNV